MSAPPWTYTAEDAPDGDPAIVAEARKIIERYSPTARVLGAWKISEEMITEFKKQTYCVYLCPISWMTLPCTLSLLWNQVEVMRHKISILTDDGVVIAVPDCKPPCSCCSTGKDYEEVLFANMGDIVVNNRGTGLCARLTFAHVAISLPGQMVGKHTRVLQIWNEDPEKIAALIRKARKAKTDAAHQIVVVQQPVVVASAVAPAIKRVMVAIAGSDTEHFKMVTATSDTTLAQLTEEAVRKMEFEGSVARLEVDMQGTRVEVASMEDIQNNDKVFIVPL